MAEGACGCVQVYQRYVQASGSNVVQAGRVKNLSWAKHRFASLSKPLGRAILQLDALIGTALWLHIHRQEAAATEFLDTMNERRLILAAMMADASDECLGLLRFFDTGTYDLADVSFEIQTFMSRLHVLYNEGQVFDAEGYTKHCLLMLEKSRGFVLNGQPRTLGGPDKVTPAVKAGCQKHMQAWLQLVASTLKSEFPHWEVLSGFSVFNLHDAETEDKTDNVRRLAKAFKLDSQTLYDELADHEHIARQIQKSTGGSSLRAWTCALQKTQARKDLRTRHPCAQLRAVLVRYAAYQGISTSPVEQAFSKLGRTIAERSLGPANEFAAMKLAIDGNVQEREHLCKMAQAVWPLHFGQPRDTSCAAPRVDAGVPRPQRRGLEAGLMSSKNLNYKFVGHPGLARLARPSSPLLMSSKNLNYKFVGHSGLARLARPSSPLLMSSKNLNYKFVGHSGLARLARPSSPPLQGTESGFLKKRRQAIDGFCLVPVDEVEQAAAQAVSLDRQDLARQEMSGKIADEMDFQKIKQLKNLIHAYQEGTLLESEIVSNLAECAEAMQQLRDKGVAERARRDQRRDTLLRPKMPDLSGSQAIWLAEAAWTALVPPSLKDRLTADAKDADLWVSRPV